MVEKVIWTKKAQKEFDAMLSYLEREASERTAENFYHLVGEKLTRLEKYPESGRLVEVQRQIRVVNLDKYRQMAYSFKGKTLHISHFFDNRQNPDKRPY
jgi:plasmid stabilization system protein ParE